MIPYSHVKGKKSRVIAYEFGVDFIRVKFTDSKIYTYTTALNGEKIIKAMKYYALVSEGLGTYITRNEAILKHAE